MGGSGNSGNPGGNMNCVFGYVPTANGGTGGNGSFSGSSGRQPEPSQAGPNPYTPPYASSIARGGGGGGGGGNEANSACNPPTADRPGRPGGANQGGTGGTGALAQQNITPCSQIASSAQPGGSGNGAGTGGGGGGGGASAGFPFGLTSGGAGGGGGGAGNPGGAGGAGNPGSVANPTTHNCVSIVGGTAYPVTVNGQVNISWCPQ